MHEIIFKEISNIISDTQGLAAPIMNIHLPKRAKFERYLQSVLANKLKSEFADTEIEYPMGEKFADIYSNGTYIELKTPNTSYKVEGIEKRHKPISKNFNSILKDIQKLRDANVKKGVVAFVLFPVSDTSDYNYHVEIIQKECKTYTSCLVGKFYIFSAEVRIK